VGVKLFASKVSIEALEIVHGVVVYWAQHGVEKGADDSHSNVTIVESWAVILVRVNCCLREKIVLWHGITSGGTEAQPHSQFGPSTESISPLLSSVRK